MTLKTVEDNIRSFNNQSPSTATTTTIIFGGENINNNDESSVCRSIDQSMNDDEDSLMPSPAPLGPPTSVQVDVGGTTTVRTSPPSLIPSPLSVSISSNSSLNNDASRTKQITTTTTESKSSSVSPSCNSAPSTPVCCVQKPIARNLKDMLFSKDESIQPSIKVIFINDGF